MPGATVTAGLPPKEITRLLPANIALPLVCNPMYAPSKVTGCVPYALDRRMRACFPQMSGRTIMRNDWSTAPRAASGNANFSSGCAVGLPIG